jgi:hypothetical protein
MQTEWILSFPLPSGERDYRRSVGQGEGVKMYQYHTTQQLEISLVIPEETSCSQMSYTAIKAMFGVLYGSI